MGECFNLHHPRQAWARKGPIGMHIILFQERNFYLHDFTLIIVAYLFLVFIVISETYATQVATPRRDTCGLRARSGALLAQSERAFLFHEGTQDVTPADNADHFAFSCDGYSFDAVFQHCIHDFRETCLFIPRNDRAGHDACRRRLAKLQTVQKFQVQRLTLGE